MSDAIIKVSNVRRTFGEVAALRGISFEIRQGQVVGFIGANGAGKTTTMRILATLDIPDAGNIEICGMDAMREAARVRQKIGWMPDAYGSYDHMTVEEYLDFFARSYGLRGRDREQRVRDVMSFTELDEISERFTDTLSKGMGQRLCLGRTLLHDPDILILDEPAAGLDPKARVDFKQLVRLLAQDGKSIFISSHILSELEDMCDTLLFIAGGKIAHHGSTSSLKRADHTKFVLDVRVCGDSEKLRQWTEMNPGVRALEQIKHGMRIEIDGQAESDLSALLRRMIADGLEIYEFHQHERRLEDAFIEMVNSLGEARDTEEDRNE